MHNQRYIVMDNQCYVKLNELVNCPFLLTLLRECPTHSAHSIHPFSAIDQVLRDATEVACRILVHYGIQQSLDAANIHIQSRYLHKITLESKSS